MGIKFHCPNGHKMNVKSFLAGKKGVCPKCGVAVEVPLVSEGEAAPALATATVAASPATAETIAEDAEVPSIAEGIGAEIESAVAAGSNGKSDNKSATKMPPVIAQNPLAIWYTCTQSGDRYGPVSGEQLNNWLGEGRVTATSLVWREGWPQWQKAVAVFPSLNPAAALLELAGGAPSLAATPAPVAAAQPKMDDLLADALSAATMASTGSATGYISSSRRRSYKDKLVLASMVMIGAVIFLGFTLLIVLINQ
jgi:hypothetical protein